MSAATHATEVTNEQLRVELLELAGWLVTSNVGDVADVQHGEGSASRKVRILREACARLLVAAMAEASYRG